MLYKSTTVRGILFISWSNLYWGLHYIYRCYISNSWISETAPPTILSSGAKSPLTKAFILISWSDKHKQVPFWIHFFKQYFVKVFDKIAESFGWAIAFKTHFYILKLSFNWFILKFLNRQDIHYELSKDDIFSYSCNLN